MKSVRKRVAFEIFSFIILLFGMQAPICLYSQTNYGANLDLEQINSSKDSLFYWRHEWNYPIQQIIEPGSITEHSIHLINTDDNQGLAYLTQEIDLLNPVLQKLRITARFKTLNMNEGVIDLYCFTKDQDKWVQYKNLDKDRIVNDTSWIETSLEVWIQPRVDQLTFGIYLKGQGEFIVDYFEVESIQDSKIRQNPHQEFMKESISIIVNNSLHKSTLDSLQLTNDWIKYLEGDTSKIANNEALKLLLKSIDSHSFLMTNNQVNAWQNTSSDNHDNIELCTGKLIEDNYGYLWMPGIGTGDSISQKHFAEHLQRLIDSLDHPQLKGWIIDIRKNTGGNCWPMLAGIGPILGEDLAGYFLSDGQYNSWNYEKGKSYQGDYRQCQIDQSPYELINDNLPIAVLVSNQTGSSGEIIAVSFKNRPNTVLIGEKTAGYSTGNINHSLTDGSMIFLESSIYCDRDKNAYPDGIDPDIPTIQEGIEDSQILQAIQWLEKK